MIYPDQRSYEIPKYSKTKVRFEISSLEIGYRQNFVMVRKLILFAPKCPNLRMWAQNFRKPVSNLKSPQLK